MTQVSAAETKKEAVAPLNPAAANAPVVSGVATTGVATSGIVVTRDGVELLVDGVEVLADEPLAVIDEIIFDGIGGFLAIEDELRGLMKAFGGDTIVTLSNGARYVVPKELKEATPIAAGVLAQRKKEREDKLKENETPAETEAREKREKAERDLVVGVTPKK